MPSPRRLALWPHTPRTTQANRVDAKGLRNWETAAHYHLIHAGAGLLAVLLRRDTAGALFLGGQAIFSGSLYAMVLTGHRGLGAITPIGGLLLVAGWIGLMP